jgi:hypothetical protein
MITLLYLPLLLCLLVRSLPITSRDLLMGEYTLRVLYDAALPFPSRVLHVLTEGSTLYAVGVNSGVTDAVVCRKVITKQVIVNPRGCDALSPTEAIVDHFCEFGGSLALQSARARTLSQWSLRPDSPQCTDKSTCFGPVYATSEGWLPENVITDMDLIQSRGGVFVVSTAGAAGEIPMVTYVPIRMPKLRLYSNCVGFEELEFEMNAKDNDAGAYVNNTYVYSAGVVRRLRFARSGLNTFRIALGNKGVGSEFYNDEFISVQEYSSVRDAVNSRVSFQTYNNQTESPTLLPTASPTNFPTTTPNPTTLSPTLDPVASGAPSVAPTSLQPTNAPTSVCSSELILVPAPRPFELIEPSAPDDLTYYLDRRGEYVTRECAIRRGSLDETNNLVFADCPPNALCGGCVRHRAPGPFGAKYRVEPDAQFKDFEWSCDKFYARSSEFTTTSGSPVNTNAPQLYACNYPFPFPAQIENKNNDVAEKLRQCKMVGGRTALESKSYCTADVTTTLCRKGWFFFDEFCYYRPNPEKDGRFKTRQADADEACASLHPKARAATAIDAYTESWLQTSFIFQNPVSCGTDPVRALVTGTRCKCYDCPRILNATLDGTVTECGCETPQFPLCYYRMKDDYIAWNDMKFCPSTLQVFKEGQCLDTSDGACLGNERYGKELQCECLPGSANEYCDRRTCIVNASTLIGDTPLLKFAQTCEKHGYCDEGQVDTCACLPNYGPPSTFGADDYNAFACSLPTTKVPRDSKSGFIVNGTFYNEAIGVCNGASAGEGICDPATRECRCLCKSRLNLDPDGEGLEPAYDGIGCTAPTPMLPANGFQINGGIVERLCNGRGTACPFGERLSEKRLDGTYLVTRDSDFCRGKPDGCVCDNGFAGSACTIPVPYDEAASKPVFAEFGAYVPIRGGRHPVMNVVIKAENAYAGVVPTCDVENVYVSDTILKSETNCTRTADEGRWWCNGTFGTYVVISTEEQRPSCSIQVFTENYLPCGNYTNPYAARLYANSAYRDFNRTDEFQSLEWAQYGGTSTECGCDAGHTGPLCRTEISSKRMDPDGTVSNRVCGETTFPPRGEVDADGACRCLFVAGYDFADSPGCACAKTPDGNRCGGVCTCRPPEFPYGRCEFDLIAAESDPLQTPFTQIAPPSSVRNSTYVVTSDAAYIEFEGKTWVMNKGQTLTIETAKGNISTSYDNARHPLNVTHECGQPENVVGPVRVQANVTIYDWVCDEFDVCSEIVSTSAEICDPAFECSASFYCGSGAYPCMIVNNWIEADDGEVLPSKRYTYTRIVQGELSPTLTQEDVDFPYGVFSTCSDPVFRWLDAGLVGAGLVQQRQCVSGFGPHDNTKGQIYGAFDDVIPGLNFRLKNWTDAHYDFISSLLNEYVCVDSNGKYEWDALTDAVMDEYLYSLVRQGGVEDRVELGTFGTGSLLDGEFNVSVTTRDDPNAWWGNPYWHLGNTNPFGPTTRWGGYVLLPKGQGEIRRVTFRNPSNETMTSFALVGPRGETCVTVLLPLLPNETFSVDCGLSFESEPLPLSLRRLYDQNLTEFAINMTQESPYALLYSSASRIEFRESDVGYASRAESYTDKWKSYSASIIAHRVFPENVPYVAECQRLGGSLRSITTEDRAFLRTIHSVVLSPIRCTHDWQCKRFAKGTAYKCVPDAVLPSEGWLNGDPTTGDDGIVGAEGGCDCRGIRQIMDPQFHGSRCASGYEAEWKYVVAYETEAKKRLENITGEEWPVVLVNLTQWQDGTPECTLPTGTSTGRPTDACGGARGRIERVSYEVVGNLTTYNTNKVKRCVAVRIGDEEYAARADELELDLHSFGEYDVNVIRGRVFFRGTELRSGEYECVERASSETFRTLSYISDSPLILQYRDEWTNYIL